MKASCSGLIPEDIILPEGRLLIAFSGGDDSLALLSLASRLAHGRSEALYVNHALRGDAELGAEEERNRSNAALLGIPFSIIRLGKGAVEKLAERKSIGTEAAARELRYEALERYRAEHGFDWILTAHHRDDQAETVAMRMLSRSPFYAWGGIRRYDGHIFRPLLSVSKSDILSYISAEGLEPSIDSTNSDTAYMRNSIRHRLMPLISEEAKDTMARIAENVASFRSRFSLKPSFSGFYISYSRDAFLSAPPFLAEEAVYEANAAFGGERVSRALVERVRKKAAEGCGSIASSSLVFMFSLDEVRIYPELPSFALPLSEGFALPLSLSLSYVREDELTLSIPIHSLIGPAIIRDAREGDIIELKGGRKRVSELIRDQKVPYAIVIEDRKGIVCCLTRLFGGRDRLARRFLGEEGEPVALALIR